MACEKTCLECGTLFNAREYRGETIKFCSRNCKNHHNGKIRKIPIEQRKEQLIGKRFGDLIVLYFAGLHKQPVWRGHQPTSYHCRAKREMSYAQFLAYLDRVVSYRSKL